MKPGLQQFLYEYEKLIRWDDIVIQNKDNIISHYWMEKYIEIQKQISDKITKLLEGFN